MSKGKRDANDVLRSHGTAALRAAFDAGEVVNGSGGSGKTKPGTPCDKNSGPPPKPDLDLSIDAEIKRLAGLSIIKYELERADFAARHGMRASVLDDLVKQAHPADESMGQGRSYSIPEIKPYPGAVDGAAVLTEVAAVLQRYVVMASDAYSIAALWVMHTYCFDCFQCSPRLAVTSPEKGCGKTTLLDVLRELVARALASSNATVSAIFRIVEMAQPTLLIDEADTFLKVNDELRGILNSGHRKGGAVLRTVGDDHEPRQFATFGAAVIAMIGRLPDTLSDRSIDISLRRRKSSERVESFRSDQADHLHLLARKMARWAVDHDADLRAADPDVGDLQNRVADNWRPLFAVADVAGGPWPAGIREIAAHAAATRTDQSVRAMLLADIKTVFASRGTDRLSSDELTAYLVSLDDRPWVEWKLGRPLSKSGLARLLSPFGILSDTIRVSSDHTAKGYYFRSFEDAFSRYLSSENVTT